MEGLGGNREKSEIQDSGRNFHPLNIGFKAVFQGVCEKKKSSPQGFKARYLSISP